MEFISCPGCNPNLASIKIENLCESKLPRNIAATTEKILSYVPKEHLRGLEKIRMVPVVNDPRLTENQRTALPGLYHPRQLNQQAWLEIAVDALLPPSSSFLKRIMPRISLKGNFAAVLYSLIGQHYYFTMRHSVKKNRLEGAVRSYTENLLKQWGEGEHRFRARMFKPLRPVFERWARDLRKRENRNK